MLFRSPPYELPADVLAGRPGVHLKVTSRVLGRARASAGGPAGALRDLVERFGSERIAWGSNYPANEGTLPELVALLDEALEGLGPDDVENIRYRTAAALYPQLAPTGNGGAA